MTKDQAAYLAYRIDCDADNLQPLSYVKWQEAQALAKQQDEKTL